ncbi:hypothetical protein SDC9_198284 [bioreactor metagenome]|uniref:RCK C-terminal domain-containing protein n=2 Tax=root TaxID=1 RepID=A0A645IIJ1_9ZZZZ
MADDKLEAGDVIVAIGCADELNKLENQIGNSK